ncbi:Low molecular weight phosphotyrosine protein phosphatase [Cyphellophora attinorum]|uniref:Low molecular weight phosphotyrosine protein phosphatase n=1 Tax=Cyphellophora attinorum TaxID=1664694 RepID=A0A0N1H4Z9_9EURO|nr:Low molecular weight phosphotyrosine protein phosphatase [Phialophora attinorum]KPI40606.1 Low molecular weight phosphotyrosine protein phosphatase [Phialophora attinorum]
MAEPISVLFVCLGNICRSPMAEGVFRSLAASDPRVGKIDSSGTGAYHTLEPPDSRTMATLRKKGITDYDHGARQVEETDFREFDYIFAMDRHNLRDLERMKRRVEKSGSCKAQVMLYGHFSGTGKEEEVVDPYYGANKGFDTVYEQVNRFSTNFLKEVVNKDQPKVSS